MFSQFFRCWFFEFFVLRAQLAAQIEDFFLVPEVIVLASCKLKYQKSLISFAISPKNFYLCVCIYSFRIDHCWTIWIFAPKVAIIHMFDFWHENSNRIDWKINAIRSTGIILEWDFLRNFPTQWPCQKICSRSRSFCLFLALKDLSLFTPKGKKIH